MTHEPAHYPSAGQNLQRETSVVRARPFSKPSAVSSRMTLIVAAVTAMIIGEHHASAANRRSAANQMPHRPLHMSHLRGGSKSDKILSSIRGGDQDLGDEDLDEYIEFLLAYADDKATEADNPLFRGMNANQVLEDENENEEESLIEPLVDNVNDDAQIDAMVETLVATVDDQEVEGDLEVENIEDHESKTEAVQVEEVVPDIELAIASSLEEETGTVEDIAVESASEETSATVVEENIEPATIPSSSDEVEKVGEVSTEPATEPVTEEISLGIVEDDTESAFDEVDDKEAEIALAAGEVTLVDDVATQTETKDEKLEASNIELVDAEEKETTKSIDDQEVEEGKETDPFYLGSSAVENMPVPLNEDQASTSTSEEVETTTEPTEKVPLFTSLMRKIGLKKEVTEQVDQTSADDVEQIEEALDAEGVAAEEANIVMGTSEDVEEHIISFGESDSELQLQTHKVDAEVTTGDVSESNQFPEEVSDSAASEFDSQESTLEPIGIKGEENTVGAEVSLEAEVAETREPDALPSIDEKTDQQVTTSVVTVAKQYYQGAWGSVKEFWSKNRWLKKETEEVPLERDYTKIYQKYFADNLQAVDADDSSPREKQDRLSNAFLRPWGTLTKYLKPQDREGAESAETSTASYYSIGIQGYIADDAKSETEVSGQLIDKIETDIEDLEMQVDGGVIITASEDDLQEEFDNEEDPASIEDTELHLDDSVSPNGHIGKEVEADGEEMNQVVAEIEDTEVQVGNEIESADVEDMEEVVDDEETFEALEDSEVQVDNDSTIDEDEVGFAEPEADIEMQVSDEIDIADEEHLQEVNNEATPTAIEDSELHWDNDVTSNVDGEEEEEVDEVESNIEFNEMQIDSEIPIADEEVVQEEKGDEDTLIEDSALQVDNDDVTLDEYEVEADVDEVDDDIEAADMQDDIKVDIADEVDVDKIGADVEGAEKHVDCEISIGDEEDFEDDETPESVEDSEFQDDVDITLDETDAEVEVDGIYADAEGAEKNVDSEIAITDEEGFKEENGSQEIPDNTEIDDEDNDSINNTSAKDSSPRKLFTRLWGMSGRTSQSDSVVEVTSEKDQTEIEENIVEIEDSIDREETGRTEGSSKRNIFMRLWGTNNESNEFYSLGLQGVPDSDSITTEDHDVISAESSTEEDTVEELDVDISVSIGESDTGGGSLDVVTFDISDSSGVEYSEEETDFPEIQSIEEQESVDVKLKENVRKGQGQDDRNVLQLHRPESEEIKEQKIHTEVTSSIASSEDATVDKNVYRLELHREEDDALISEYGQDNIAAAQLEDALAIMGDSPGSDQDDVLLESECALEDTEEENHEENAESSIAAEVIEDAFSDEDSIEEDYEEKEFEAQTLAETANDELSEEGEDEEEGIICEEEEDEEEGIICEEGEDEEDDIISEEEEVLEEALESSIVAEVIEDIFEEEEISDNEELVKVADIIENEFSDEDFVEEEGQEDLDVSFFEDSIEDEEQEGDSYYHTTPGNALEVEMESANFVTRFLVNKGLGQVVIIAILIMEWFHMYVVAPFFESVDWIKYGKGQDLLQTVLSSRGGALASSVSDGEDVGQIEEDDEEGDEDGDVLTEVEPANESVDEEQSDRLTESETDGDEQSETISSAPVPADVPAPSRPRVPPNFIFRHLANYGLVGHILIMELVMASEWLQVYVPQITSLASYIAYDLLNYKRDFRRGREEPVNKRNSGFVNIGEGSRLGKKPKKLRKKEDQAALDQLKRIGDVNNAKCRFLSQKFMERHAIGPFSATISEIELDLNAVETDFASKKRKRIEEEEEEEAESDSGWILDALEVEEEDAPPLKNPFDTSVGVSLGSGGPKVSVGMEFTIGKKKRTKSSSEKLRSVLENDTSGSENKIKTPKPHVSDSESGVMGRLRAAGANSVMGRSILGAYPGDLPPPDEAASPRGVIGLARRYGYGDWSDDDNDDNDDSDNEDDVYGDLFNKDDEEKESDDFFSAYSDDEYQSRPKKRSGSAKKKRTRKRRSSSHEQPKSGVSVEFGFGTSSKSQASFAASSPTRRRRKSSSLSSSTVADSVSSSARRRKSRGSRLPSSPMEKLGGVRASSTSTAKPTSSSTAPEDSYGVPPATTIKRKKRPSTLRPAGFSLDEANKKSTGSSKKE